MRGEFGHGGGQRGGYGGRWLGASVRLLNMEWQKNLVVKCEMGMRLYKLTASRLQATYPNPFMDRLLLQTASRVYRRGGARPGTRCGSIVATYVRLGCSVVFFGRRTRPLETSVRSGQAAWLRGLRGSPGLVRREYIKGMVNESASDFEPSFPLFASVSLAPTIQHIKPSPSLYPRRFAPLSPHIPAYCSISLLACKVVCSYPILVSIVSRLLPPITRLAC